MESFVEVIHVMVSQNQRGSGLYFSKGLGAHLKKKITKTLTSTKSLSSDPQHTCNAKETLLNKICVNER